MEKYEKTIKDYAEGIFDEKDFDILNKIVNLNNLSEKGRRLTIKELKYAKDSLGLELSDLLDGVRGAMWRTYISYNFCDEHNISYNDVKQILEKYKDIIINLILKTSLIRARLLQEEEVKNGEIESIVSREDLDFLNEDFLKRIVDEFILKNDNPIFPNIERESFEKEEFWIQQAYIVLMCETIGLIRKYNMDFLQNNVEMVREDIDFGIYIGSEFGSSYEDKDKEKVRRLGRSFGKDNIKYFIELEHLIERTQKLLESLNKDGQYSKDLKGILKDAKILLTIRDSNSDITIEEIKKMLEIENLPEIEETYNLFKKINREMILDSLIDVDDNNISIINSANEEKFMLLHFLPQGDNDFDKEMSAFMCKQIGSSEYEKIKKILLN